jgi:AcrR family transcriptional regulator
MSSEVLLPRKQPRQARSAATVDIILEAATRVLSERSLAGFNTNRIAEVAGVSVGSVYQYFPNKASLVTALIERAQSALAEAIETSAEKTRGQALSAVLYGMIDVAIDHQFGNRILAAALDHEEQRLPLDHVLSAAQVRIINAVHQALSSTIELRTRPLPDSAAADCLTIAKAMIETEANVPVPDVLGLRQRIERAIRGYLLTTGSETT